MPLMNLEGRGTQIVNVTSVITSVITLGAAVSPACAREKPPPHGARCAYRRASPYVRHLVPSHGSFFPLGHVAVLVAKVAYPAAPTAAPPVSLCAEFEAGL